MVIVSPLTISAEELIHQSLSVKLKIDATEVPKPGDLYITTSNLCWKENGREEGISIPWTNVSLHAITNEQNTPRSIYIMLDFIFVWPGVHENNRNGNGINDEDEEDEGHVEGDLDQEYTELLFTPAHAVEIDELYAHIKQCQLLNPDPNDSFSEEDEEEFMEALDEQFDGELQNLNLDDPNRFADADEN